MFGFNNAEPIDVGDANKRLREECQGLLLQDESIDLGFKAIRDEFYFTTHRILFVDKQGITGKKTEYKSCPYHSIKAFSVETSGGFDSDSEMKVYAGSLDLSIDFDKKKVDIFEIQKYLSGHVFADSMEELLAYNTANPQQAFTGKEGGSSAKLMDYLAGDSVKLDESIVENELNAIGALVPNEKIKLAYKCGRDMVICTSKRMLYVDTQGFSGKRIEYLSMRYSCIKGYEVETAGSWDRDAEFKIFTNISQEKRCLKTDLRKGQCDVMEVLWYFNNKLLGVDSMTLEEFLPLASQSGGSANSLMSFFGDDMSQIDATLADQQFHSNPPILQANETCEIAFKGRRDLVLFTTKRILFVDKQGWSGKKMAYITFPYSSIKIFNAATAGSMDKDCEFGFYTEVWFDPPKCNGCENGCGNEEPTPGMSYIEFDINKHTTDLLGLYRYVAGKVHRNHFVGGWAGLEIPRNEMLQPSPQGAVQNLLNYIGQDFTELDPVQIETMLSMGGQSPILIDDEKVLMAFKCGRDMTIFTSKAILSIDRKGLTGKKTEFQNIPYDTILNFATESNGSFDRDSELKLTFATPWLPNLTQDFRSGKADIVAIQNLIAAKCLGAPGKPSDFANDDTIKPSDPGSMEKLIAFISDKHLKDDPKAIEQKFKTEVPVLQADETVELAYKHGRDMFIITNKRIMLIDVQGLSGKKIEFKSIPYKFIKGFSVESAGTLSRTVKATLYCSKMVGGLGTDFGKKDTNIFEINNSVANKILNHTTHQT